MTQLPKTFDVPKEFGVARNAVLKDRAEISDSKGERACILRVNWPGNCPLVN
jgi:hypothetical protein